MTSFITKSQNKIHGSANNICVRNHRSSILEFYELKGPYMIICEDFDIPKQTEKVVLYAPRFFSEDTLDLSPSSPFSNRSLHCHDYFELMFVLAGDSMQNIEGQNHSYKTGQFCILNQNIKHIETPQENCTLLFLAFSNTFIQDFHKNDIIFDDEGYPVENSNLLYSFFSNSLKSSNFHQKYYLDIYPLVSDRLIIPQIENIFTNLISETKRLEAGAYFRIQGLIASLFDIILTPTFYQIRAISPVSSKEEYLFIKIRQLLEERHGKITREELSSRLNYNAHYLNRIVNHSVGMSLLEYGRVFTLKEAARLLVETNNSITSIMSKLNLSNRSFFYSNFKKQYGLTPHEYRLKNQTQVKNPQ